MTGKGPRRVPAGAWDAVIQNPMLGVLKPHGGVDVTTHGPLRDFFRFPFYLSQNPLMVFLGKLSILGLGEEL